MMKTKILHRFLLSICISIFVNILYSQTPVISGFSPSSGSVGTLVTITGTGLDNPTNFTIAGVNAIVISNTGTQLVGMVMPGATTGLVSITTSGGTANSAGNFTAVANQVPNTQQGNKLVGTGAVGKAVQGYSVSISADGNTAIVGGYGDNNNAGAAWIYTRSGGIWSQQGNKLVGTGATGNALQGTSVSISADGNTAIVGGYGDNNYVGAAWIYTRSGGIWSQQGKLVGTGAVGNSAQGWSVSISADGNTAIVGGYGDNNGVGAVWIYMRSGGIWSQQGNKLVGAGAVGSAYQGYSVSISAEGNTAIVGGALDNNQTGAVWVYMRSGGVWNQQGNKLVGSGAIGNALQGTSVSLSADGNTAIIGGYYDNNQIGAAWIFIRSGEVWNQQGNKLVGTDVVGNAIQGVSVSLSADGNTAIVGGPLDNNYVGAAWIYARKGGTWMQQSNKLVGTGASGIAFQGRSVSLSADGNTAIACGFYDNSYAGAAWIFTTSIPIPVTPIINLTQPTCAIATGTITISSPTGADITYSIDGINYQTGTTFSSVSPGTYSVTAKNAGGTSTATTAVINAQPATPVAPTINITQPTCNIASGTITVTAPTETGMTYSIDGINYQNSTTFSNASVGNYSVTAKNASGCISTITSAVINAQPSTPTAPTVSIIQPSCAVTTGTITITTPTEVGMTYSSDGINYQSSTTFSNVSAGDYSVTAKNASGCISSVTTTSVNAQPATPVAPTVSVTQPSCSVSTGTITVTAPLGTYTYSIDGATYQSSTIFAGVQTGNYSVTAKNASGCISPVTSATVNGQLVNTVVADITGTASVCAGSTTSLSDATLGGIWSTSDASIASVSTGGVVTGVKGGHALISYSVFSICGIVSKSLSVTVNSPTTSTTNLVICESELPFIWNGNSYNGSGTYTTHLTNAAGCDSAATLVLTVLQAPAAPTVSVTQPSCAIATGTITVTAPTEAGMTYSIDGINYQSSTTFSKAVAGSYSVTAKNAGGCISAITSAIVNEQIGNPVVADITGTSDICKGSTSALADSTMGGVWSSDNLLIATVDQNGLVSASETGSATIKYSVSNSCGLTIKHVVVNVSDCGGGGNVNGGGGGGLESKDLGDAIVKRVYNKAFNNLNGAVDYNKLTVVGSGRTAGPTTFGLGGIASVTLSGIMPDITNSGYVAYNSTPLDITSITNAAEVIATDFTINQEPKAVAFATKTLGALYDHTKPICDRLKGASLLNIAPIKVGGYDFVQYTLKDENGVTEYATSFSIGTKSGRNNFSVQSTWLLKDYISEDVMYNFQLWAATPQLVNAMITDVLNKVKAVAPVASISNINIPATYIVSGNRTGTNLNLVLTNGTANTSGYFTVQDQSTELSTTTASRQIPFTLNANGQSTVSIPMNDLYESTISMYVNGTMTDVVYMADGAWTVDYNKATTSVSSFTVKNDAGRVYDTTAYSLLRNATVTGNSSDYVSVIKLLRGGGAAADLTAYKTLQLTASGGNTLRVTLVKNSITNWADQYYTEIKLDDNQKDYYLSLNNFISTASKDKINADDVTTVVFAIEVGTATNTAINTTLSNISFVKQDANYLNNLNSKDIQLYPNPATARNFTCSFYSNADAQELTLKVTDVMGRTIATKQVNAVKGLNIVPVSLNTNTTGIHVVTLDGNSVKYNSKKIVLTY